MSRFFVSYTFEGNGFGNGYINTDKESDMVSMNDIIKFQDDISEDPAINGRQVCVLSVVKIANDD